MQCIQILLFEVTEFFLEYLYLSLFECTDVELVDAQVGCSSTLKIEERRQRDSKGGRLPENRSLTFLQIQVNF